MQIDLERMQRRLAALTTPELGGTPAGGMSRLALSDEDKGARDLLIAWMHELGMETRFDDFGNIYGRRAGSEPNLDPVLVGSHLDTVPGGGRFDGILGVVSALEVASALNDAGVTTRRPIEVVDWTNEEGARFTPAMLASGGAIGVFERDWVYARADRQGRTFGAELERIGYRGEASARLGKVAASFELHIEQGPVLEAGGESVGIVEGVVGIRWCKVTVHGQSAHAGPTPMAMRRDALVAAARMLVALRDNARAQGGHNATVGSLIPEPGVVNVIPPVVTFSVDLRSQDDALLNRLTGQDLPALFDAIAAEERVAYTLDVEWAVPPTPFDAAIIERAEAVCNEHDYSARRLWAGAGHDSQYIARVARAFMLFTPTTGGLSHCETEAAPWPEIGKTANVLLALVAEEADR